MATIKILLADDHKIVRDGIKLMLQSQTGMDVVEEASNEKEVLEKLEHQMIDLVVMDINMPERHGIRATKEIRDNYPNTRVLALTMSNDDLHIRQMIQAGASGYIMKSAGRSELKNAIISIMDGKHYFSDDATHSIMMDLVRGRGKSSPGDVVHITDRELEILELIIKEYTNQEIAQQLVVSRGTVKAHTASIYRKLNVANRTEAVAHARQLGILP